MPDSEFDNSPIPVLRRAPELLDSRGKPVKETLVFAGDERIAKDARSRSSNSNLRRSISHRISRATAATPSRNPSEPLRPPRSSSHSRVGDGHVRIRQAKDRKNDAGPSLAPGPATHARVLFDTASFTSATHSNPAHDQETLVMTTSQLNPNRNGVGNGNGNGNPTTRPAMAEVPVPALLQQGVPMTKVSAKSQKSYIFKLDADQGQIIWESKKLRIIPIEHIKELRSGSDARYYRQQFQLAREYEDRWITIIYMLEGQYKTLHLIASSPDSFHLWDITLRKLHAIRQELMTGVGNEEIRQAVWIKQCWKSSDEQNDQRLSFEQVEKLCRRLNINSSQEDLMRIFTRADSRNRRYLDFADFQTFVKLLKARPELDLLHKKLCTMDDRKLTFDVFECFMRNVQQSTLSRAELSHLFVRFCARAPDGPGALSNPDIASLTMSLDAFVAFLLSSENSPFADQSGKVNQPMTYPLSDYFISSSHNTYLVGNQLVGDSTIEGYIRALLSSCRSVELDIYDGEQGPMVYHGGTLTSKVSVREVCEAIIKYAFVTSPYPIIISAEIHCSVPQQEMIAAIMHEVFGDALVRAPLEGRPLNDKLPSPEDLKGRVLLKAKNLYVSENESLQPRDLTLDADSSTEASASDTDGMHEIREELKKTQLREMEAVKELKGEFRKARNVFSRVRVRHPSPERGVSATAALVGTATTAATAVAEHAGKTDTKHDNKVKMSSALVALLVYTVGVKCRGINKKEHYAPEHLFSLSETTMNKIVKQGPEDLIKHTKTHLVRTYPKGTRVSSSNYLPHRYWATGAQLVAINWQTFDLGYMINHAMFQRNGRAGYLLKPAALRKSEDHRKPEKEHLHFHTQHYLEVTVISAQQLPRPKDAMGHEIMDKHVDPYVEVSVHTPDWIHPNTSSASLSVPPSSSTSLSASTSSPSSSSGHSHVHGPRTMTTLRTSAVKHNGFNPVWQETLRLPFECVGDMRELVFVKFTVQRDGEPDGEPIGVYCTSLKSLAMGYRHLPLHDSQLSQYLFSTLFVRCAVYDG